ncbi:hypothetical protein VNO80_06865 [Phaseolus coccineus]|uniref:Uncharacterized protein n=1 Tax=Phaseolus coccineus TaxID=3886 RepID=A0AAN9RJC2_PHACN
MKATAKMPKDSSSQRQKNLELRKRIERLQSELQHSQGLLQEAEQLQAEKSKEAADRAREAADRGQEAASLTKEKNSLLDEVDKLKRDLTLKDETLAKATNSFKEDVVQSCLVGFEAAVGQASAFHPTLDFTEHDLGKTLVDGQLRDD